jgi:hypothetical protein
VLTSDAAQRIGRLLVEDDGHDDASTPLAPSSHLSARSAAPIIFLGIALAMLHAAHTTGSFGARVRVSPANPIGRPEELPMPQSVTRAAMASAVALSIASTASAQEAVQWRVEDGGNGHWYRSILLEEQECSWTSARHQALEIGADLGTLTSTEEAAWVFDAVASDPRLWKYTFGPWLGGYQIEGAEEPAGGWVWLDGSPLDPGLWKPGEPTNYLPCGAGEDYLNYYSFDGPRNTVNDLREAGICPCCGNPADLRVISAVIEWSADCNADGIVDYGQIRAGDLADTNGNNIPDCCESLSDACAGDLVRDGRVDGVDLAAVLNNWGLSEGAALNADANCDGVVDGQDLATVLGSWGKCP